MARPGRYHESCGARHACLLASLWHKMYECQHRHDRLHACPWGWGGGAGHPRLHWVPSRCHGTEGAPAAGGGAPRDLGAEEVQQGVAQQLADPEDGAQGCQQLKAAAVTTMSEPEAAVHRLQHTPSDSLNHDLSRRHTACVLKPATGVAGHGRPERAKAEEAGCWRPYVSSGTQLLIRRKQHCSRWKRGKQHGEPAVCDGPR